jgi:citrate lyase beta subunit
LKSSIQPSCQPQKVKICCHAVFHIDAHISEIVRAAKILKEMKRVHEAEIGAVGLDGQMIDAPMIKQVIVICRSFSHLNRQKLGAENY